MQNSKKKYREQLFYEYMHYENFVYGLFLHVYQTHSFTLVHML